jgi:sec-independent protein translocase protein TatC
MTEEMPFWEHVEELRWRLFKCLFAIVIGAFITHFFSDELLLKLIDPSTNLNFPLNLQVLKVTSMFMVKMGMALMGGIIIALPIIIYQTWCFISPAFKEFHNASVIFIVGFSTFFLLQELCLDIKFSFLLVYSFLPQ